MTNNPAVQNTNRLPWIGILLGIGYGLVLRLAATDVDLRFLKIPQVVSFSFILLMPVAMGAITVWFGSRAQRARYLFRIFAPWLTIVGIYAVFLVSALETLVCLVMLFPAFAIAASLGGILAGWGLTFAESRRAVTLLCFALLPVVVSPIEDLVPARTEYLTVTTSRVVHAPREAVWQHVTNVPAIPADELPWSFSQAIGLPKPLEARLDRAGIGATRDIFWERDVHFMEHITGWNEGEGFSYSVDVTPAARALKILDMHIVIGDQYFDVTEGRYMLRSIENGDTIVTLSTTYRMSTRVNFYGRLWANFVLNDFHQVVLEVIGKRAEHDLGVSSR
jgi:hypothetical protein